MLSLTRLTDVNAGELLAALTRSRDLHGPWMDSPLTARAVAEYVEATPDSTLRYALREAGGELAGVVSVSAIVRGAFHSAYLGFYALVPHQARGLMRNGIKMVMASAFTEHALHRLEANVQPANFRSANLVQGLGFRLEGHSPRYLKIGGAWRDHDRYALTVEEWSPEGSSARTP